jgi:predicted membrane-bound spermidine synthase
MMHRATPIQDRTTARPLSLIGSVFFVSGFATLIYQIAWQRLLTVYYGVGPVSIAVIVSIFLLGLGIGGFVGGFVAERVRRLALLYSFVEFGLGAYGIASIPFLDYLGRSTAGSSYAWTALFSAFFLLPPTMLMGATLPIILKLYNRFTRRFLESLSFLYFVNTLGAATGALVGGYVLISLFDLDGAIGAAVCLNVGLALLVLVTMRQADRVAPIPRVQVPSQELLGTAAIWLVFTTGFIAIAYEIAWTLSLSNILKSSPYMFSTVLFVYLLGIALGSYGMNRIGRHLSVVQCRSLFFLLQVLIAVAASLPIILFKRLVGDHALLSRLYTITNSSEVHPPVVNMQAGWDYFWQTWGSASQLFLLFDILFWPLLFMLIPTLLIGASFPLIAYLANSDGEQEARATGLIYLANVLGNVVGGVTTGFVLLPHLGSEPTFLLLALLGVAFALGISHLGRVRVPLALRGAPILVLGLGLFVEFPAHGDLIYWAPSRQAEASGRYFDEGQSGIVTTYLRPGNFSMAINGLGHGGRDGLGFGEGRAAFYIEAYGALRAASSVDDVMVIGFGTGSGTEAVLTDDAVKRVTVVEVNETVIANLRRQALFRQILDGPRVRLIIDDARRVLDREGRKYDVVLMDPLLPTTVYSNNIYSREFFRLVQSRLNPSGVLMIWISTNEQMATVASVFAHVRQECSIYLLASDEPIRHRRDIASIINSVLPEHARKAIAERRKLCPPQDTDISAMPNTPILTDKRPILEYHLGRAYHLWRASSQ